MVQPVNPNPALAENSLRRIFPHCSMATEQWNAIKLRQSGQRPIKYIKYPNPDFSRPAKCNA